MKSDKTHWDKIYRDKESTQVSWYEPMPDTSLSFITECKLDKDAAIIDIGGGDSSLVDFLLAKDFEDITVLDISENAINRTRARVGERAEEVNWIVADVLEFIPERKYNLWHDRAAFHFLNEEWQVKKYLEILEKAVDSGGFVVISTFSENGPDKCSGLEVKKYSITNLITLFSESFNTMSCKNVDHRTPSGVDQNFSFCSFQKK